MGLTACYMFRNMFYNVCSLLLVLPFFNLALHVLHSVIHVLFACFTNFTLFCYMCFGGVCVGHIPTGTLFYVPPNWHHQCALQGNFEHAMQLVLKTFGASG